MTAAIQGNAIPHVTHSGNPNTNFRGTSSFVLKPSHAQTPTTQQQKTAQPTMITTISRNERSAEDVFFMPRILLAAGATFQKEEAMPWQFAVSFVEGTMFREFDAVFTPRFETLWKSFYSPLASMS